jgi:hypothetical protein
MNLVHRSELERAGGTIVDIDPGYGDVGQLGCSGRETSQFNVAVLDVALGLICLFYRPQVGTVIALSLQTAMIKAAGPDHPELVILHCRDGESSTRACLALTVATIQDTATSIKQTTIDLVLHSVAIHTRGRALWMHHIGEILKPPVGVRLMRCIIIAMANRLLPGLYRSDP